MTLAPTTAPTLPNTLAPTLTVPPTGTRPRTYTPLKSVDEPPPNTAKLSVLQKAILETAYRWKCKGVNAINIADIKAEVLCWPFSCEKTETTWETSEEGNTKVAMVITTDYMEFAEPGTVRINGDNTELPYSPLPCLTFDVGAIGSRKYNSGCASISRALKRLRARGLIDKHPNGRSWELTTDGAVLVND